MSDQNPAKHRKAFLEITNVCNLSCAFCPKTTRPPHMLTESEFHILANKLKPFAEYLYFHLMGEPTAHPLLPHFLQAANQMEFRTMLTTNGTLLSHCGDSLLFDGAAPYKVSISLHAFEANDITISFHDYFVGCINFAKNAAAHGTITALRLWNLDGRASGALHEQNDMILSLLHDAFPGVWQENRSGYKLSDRIFLEWGEKFDWPNLHAKEYSETGFCYGLRDQIGVLSDGTVVPCCLDRDGDLALGNLFCEDLNTILASQRARRIYDGFSFHICTEALCRRCMRAGYYRAK